jgi:hypothetical protein
MESIKNSSHEHHFFVSPMLSETWKNTGINLQFTIEKNNDNDDKIVRDDDDEELENLRKNVLLTVEKNRNNSIDFDDNSLFKTPEKNNSMSTIRKLNQISITTPLQATDSYINQNSLCLAPKKGKRRHRRISRLLHGGDDEDCIDNNDDGLHDFGKQRLVTVTI